MKKFIIKILEFFKNLIYPKGITCNFCRKELDKDNRYLICDDCYEKLIFNNDKVCDQCGAKINNNTNLCSHCFNDTVYYNKARSVFVYDGIIIKQIHNLKYFNSRYLAETFNKFLMDKYVTLDFNADIIVPVPLHIKRYKQRGYNQSYLICKDFEKNLSIPVKQDILLKVRHTKSQTRLSRKDRIENVSDVYSCENTELIKNKVVLLIDDVMTTGTTINECSKTLKEFGAKKVYILTLASVEIKQNSLNQNEIHID